MQVFSRIAGTLVTAALLGLAATSYAQDWKKKVSVVGFASVSAENQAATMARFKEVGDVFKEKTGVEMKIYTASDYAGTVQALTSGQIHMAQMGASAATTVSRARSA